MKGPVTEERIYGVYKGGLQKNMSQTMIIWNAIPEKDGRSWFNRSNICTSEFKEQQRWKNFVCSE